jgi:LacI family fructose operon transcriptional repressor
MTSIKDIAEAAGVSTATVSRVLSGKPHVRPELRERVQAIVKELDYRPSRVAQALRLQRASIIGIIIADIQNPFFTAVCRSIEDMTYEQDMAIFLCNSDENPDKEAIYLDHMRRENVAGVIFAPTRHTADNFAQSVDHSVPMVVIDRCVQGMDVDSVLIDNVESARQLTEHLITDGYRRIGAMFGIDSTTGRERREGFMRAMRDHSLTPPPDRSNFVEARESAGHRETMRLLQSPDRPEAILTSNGLLAAGAFRAIREYGLRIPDDIAFASFDDTPWTTLVEPPITVIQQPTFEIGRTAVSLLLERLKNPSRPCREVILKTKLMVRQSCGCPR